MGRLEKKKCEGSRGRNVPFLTNRVIDDQQKRVYRGEVVEDEVSSVAHSEHGTAWVIGVVVLGSLMRKHTKEKNIRNLGPHPPTQTRVKHSWREGETTGLGVYDTCMVCCANIG